MTEPFSHRAIWRIAAPMILSAVTAPLLGLVDTAMMGHLDAPWYLGAVAAGATIFSVLFVGMNFLRMGTTGITAQAFGAGNTEAMRESLGQAALVALAIATLLLLLRSSIAAGAVSLLNPSAEVAAYISQYFAIRIWSAPAALLNFVVIGWLLGMQNARGPLAIALGINGSNIALDLWFVLGLDMTVDGVATATLIAEHIGLVIGFVFVNAELARHTGYWDFERFFRLKPYRQLLRVNSSLLLRTLALMFVFAFITARGARLGDIVLAANGLLMNFQLFLSYALDGIAHAAEALVGKAVGARDRNGMLLAVRRTLGWSLLFASGFFVAYLLGGAAIIDLLTSIDEVRIAAREYLPWLIALPLISFWSFLYDGVYVGATRTREMMVIMVGSVLLLFLPAWYIFSPLGNHALWLAFTLFMAGRGLGMHLWFRRRLAATITGHTA